MVKSTIRLLIVHKARRSEATKCCQSWYHRLTLHSALYPRGDPYESSDPVFGVKESLVVDLSTVSDPDMAKKYSVKEGTPLLTYHFVLVTKEETMRLRRDQAMKAIKSMGRSLDDFRGLPILDVD